jgi:hypothetical protein
MHNPFREAIVADPWSAAPADLAEINADPFAKFRQLYEPLLQNGRSTALLLLGEAGSGKTHLLGRIRTWLLAQQPRPLFAAVRLQTSPSSFWRYLRRCLVQDLLRPAIGERSQLEVALLTRIREMTTRKRLGEQDFTFLAEQLGARLFLSPNLQRALVHLARRRHVADVQAWLKGYSLPESSLQRLGLADDEEDGEPEERAREFVLEICRLAGGRLPVVLCFDQIEALQRFPGDTSGLFTFGQAAAFLHDRTTNLLLVSCIQSLYRLDFEKALPRSDFDRLAAHQGTLQPVTLPLARSLVAARLAAAPEPRDLPRELQERIEGELQRFVGPRGKSARRILTRCAELYDLLLRQSPAPPAPPRPAPPDRILEREREIRQESALGRMTPERTDEILCAAVPLLVNALDPAWREIPARRTPDLDLVLQGEGLDVGISLCNQRNMKSLAARFRRLLVQRETAGLDRLLLVRHPRLSINPGAARARAYLGELQARGDRLLHPSDEVLAALEALGSLLADARSGDLAGGDEALDEASVQGWLQHSLGGAVRDFLDALRDTRPAADREGEALRDALLALLEREKVIALETLAAELKLDVESLRRCLAPIPDQAGLIEGPAAVVFQYIAAPGDAAGRPA